MKNQKNILAAIKISDKLKAPFLISILVTFVTSFISVTVLFTIQPVIPLLYSLAQPEQQLVNKQWILIFPIVSFIINFFHLIIANLMKNFRQVLLQIFVWSTVLLQFLLLLAMIRIIIILT